MGPQDIEQLLASTKHKHLSDATLISYRDSQLDEITQALADAHLRLCLVCDRRFTFLREEAKAFATIEIPVNRAEDNTQTIRDRLSSYINNLVMAWILPFSQEPVRGAGDGDEVWRYESEDGLLTGWAVLENDASLTVQLSSPEVAWEGAQLQFRLGPFSKEVTLQREGNTGVTARIEIARAQRARNMADFEIKFLYFSASG